MPATLVTFLASSVQMPNPGAEKVVKFPLQIMSQGFGIDGAINLNFHFICKPSSGWVEVYGKSIEVPSATTLVSFCSQIVVRIILRSQFSLLLCSGLTEILHGKNFQGSLQIPESVNLRQRVMKSKEKNKKSKPVKIYCVYVKNIHSPI